MAFPKAPAILASRDLRAADLERNPPSPAAIYAWMQLARVADNRILELFRQGLIRGTVTGGQGNEWMIVPLALLATRRSTSSASPTATSAATSSGAGISAST
jgi:2-oxoisovalerate dehydrogenase E1 component